jgi:predicted ATPase
MLVVLDSCDHVVEAAAALAENLLKGTQGLNILATIDAYASLSSNSSKRANARPTNTWTAGNASASTAVNLREMRGTFSCATRCTRATSGTRELATVRICRNLDRIALATELAAGRRR